MVIINVRKAIAKLNIADSLLGYGNNETYYHTLSKEELIKKCKEVFSNTNDIIKEEI